ncbi:MAG: hypothetical protein V1907_02530 [Candidatus Kerfeldbacteria bacterium]
MKKHVLYSIIIVVIILIIGGYFVVRTRSTNSNSTTTTNTTTASEQTLGTNGVTFKSPAGLTWADVPSTEGNYKNYQLNSTATANASWITVSIPLKESSQAYTLAQELKGVTDTSKIRPSTLNGHSGELITYKKTTTAPGDVKWVGVITKRQYVSRYASSPVRLEYNKGELDYSLDAAWQLLKSSITW